MLPTVEVEETVASSVHVLAHCAAGALAPRFQRREAQVPSEELYTNKLNVILRGLL